MTFVDIEDRRIGPGRRTLVVAEIGVNHDGSLWRARELVERAADAGADAVKFQIFSANRLVHPSATLADYQQARVGDVHLSEMLRTYELPPLEIAQLTQFIRRRKLIPLATPFSMQDVELIEHLELPAIKIASPDLVNRLLLQRCAQLRRPMIVSTGAATLEEIGSCVTWMTEWRVPFALMHCVSAYPTPVEQVNLRWIKDLAARFESPIGHSDHTAELFTGALAVVAGACIVEKHLTYDRAARGPDHAASADPPQFAEYVRLIRLAETMLGTASRDVLPIERDVRTVSRQSLVIQRDVEPGELIGESDLDTQRPGTGISPADASRAIGRRVRRRIPRGTLLQWDMLSDAA